MHAAITLRTTPPTRLQKDAMPNLHPDSKEKLQKLLGRADYVAGVPMGAGGIPLPGEL